MKLNLIFASLTSPKKISNNQKEDKIGNSLVKYLFLFHSIVLFWVIIIDFKDSIEKQCQSISNGASINNGTGIKRDLIDSSVLV